MIPMISTEIPADSKIGEKKSKFEIKTEVQMVANSISIIRSLFRKIFPMICPERDKKLWEPLADPE